jgi:hypothetical protein
MFVIACHRLDRNRLLVLNERQGAVLDVIFVAMTLAFFAVSVGYVALCDRLMK